MKHYLIINGESTRELFEAPFNLAGEPIDNSITAEGEARVRALAESEARKAQTTLDFTDDCGCGFFHVGLCDV